MSDIKLSNYMKMMMYRPRYLINENNNCSDRVFDIIGGGEKVEITDLDFKLLKIISINSRLTFTDIAKKIKSSPKLVKKSFHKLIDLEVIKGFRINLDFAKMGYQLFKLDIFLKDFKFRNHIIDYVKENPYLWAICFTAGHAHLEFEFHLKNIDDIIKIMDDIYIKYPISIKNYDFFIIRGHSKYLWLI
jgi:DNA-binding Lrp family transcriptional regulator